MYLVGLCCAVTRYQEGDTSTQVVSHLISPHLKARRKTSRLKLVVVGPFCLVGQGRKPTLLIGESKFAEAAELNDCSRCTSDSAVEGNFIRAYPEASNSWHAEPPSNSLQTFTPSNTASLRHYRRGFSTRFSPAATENSGGLM